MADTARNLGAYTRAALRLYERGQRMYPRYVEQVADGAEQKVRERLAREGKRQGRVTVYDWRATLRELALWLRQEQAGW
jgi:hypothetical protein